MNRKELLVIDVIIKYSGDFDILLSALKEKAIDYVEDLGSGYALTDIPPGGESVLYSIPEVEDVELSKEVFLSELPFENGCIVNSSFVPLRYSGKDVVVGIVDTGIDYTSSEFRFSDGSSRIKYFWDQIGNGSPPEGFLTGAEYTEEMLNDALFSDNPFSVIQPLDVSGHGTAVAAVAAGSSLGRAPESDIIAVRVSRGFGEESTTLQLMRGLYYCIQKALQLKKPLAVNISYGLNRGSHRGDSLFERYISDISSMGRTSVIIPTGNEGDAGHHYEGQLSQGETIDITFFTASLLRSFYLSLWKNYTDSISTELILPNGRSIGVINEFSDRTDITANGMKITAFYGRPSVRSVFQEILYDVRMFTAEIPSGLWTLRIRADRIVNGHFDLWLPTTEQVTRATFFTDPSDRLTMTIPSTADRMIRVSGFDKGKGSVPSFSGRGADYPFYITPDAAAQAVNVRSSTLSGSIGSFTGTSFAAPLVTGLAAQLMEWGIVCGNSPFLYGEKLRAQIRLLAQRRDGVRYPDTSIGYGFIS